MNERIVAAAILVRGVTFSKPRPARHHNLIYDFFDVLGRHDDEQGFLTSDGRYVGREEAYDIAVAAGQIIAGATPVRGFLFSEDVW